MENNDVDVRIDPTAINAARSSAAWFNHNQSGVVLMRGGDRLDLLHRMSTNDLTNVPVGKGKQTVLVTEKARIIDVLTVLQDEAQAMILVSTETPGTVVSWLRKYIIMEDVKVSDASSTWARLDVVGPHSARAVQEVTGEDVGQFALCQWVRTQDPSPLTIVRVPSVADLGFAILGSPDAISTLSATLESSAETLPKLTPEAYEYLRVCAGVGSHGHEYTDAYNPLEAGLLHLTSFTKGCYIGQEIIARLDSYNKVKQRIMGLQGRHFELHDELIADGEVVGKITSIASSCTHAHMLAIAYVRQVHAVDASTISVRASDGTMSTALIHLLPMTDPCQ